MIIIIIYENDVHLTDAYYNQLSIMIILLRMVILRRSGMGLLYSHI